MKLIKTSPFDLDLTDHFAVCTLMHLGWLVAVVLCVTTGSAAFQKKKLQVICFLKSFSVNCFISACLLAFGQMKRKQICHSEVEPATIKTGVIKQEDREVHIADATLAISMPIFICGCSLTVETRDVLALSYYD